MCPCFENPYSVKDLLRFQLEGRVGIEPTNKGFCRPSIHLTICLIFKAFRQPMFFALGLPGSILAVLTVLGVQLAGRLRP